MNEIAVWISKNWAELLAVLGFSSGGGYLGMKAADKRQDGKIEFLEEKVSKIDLEIMQVKNDIEMNTRFDKQLREQMAVDYARIEKEIEELKTINNKILDKLLK